MKLFNQLKTIYNNAAKDVLFIEGAVMCCIVAAIWCAYMLGATYYALTY